MFLVLVSQTHSRVSVSLYRRHYRRQFGVDVGFESDMGPASQTHSQTVTKLIFAVPCHHDMARPQVAGEGLPRWSAAANI
jgi:hypothetical protein